MTQHSAKPRIGKRLSLIAWLAFYCIAPAIANSLSPLTYKQLTVIHEQIDQQAYDDALKTLNILLEDVGDHAYEKAVVLQTLGYVQTGRQDYPAAIQAFEQSLALELLPDDTQQRIRYDLAQLCLTSGKTVKAINVLEYWFGQTQQAGAAAYVLLGQAYAQNKQYRKAIPALQRAIELSDTHHAEWYEALLAMHYELQSYQACIPLLKDMIRLFPQRRAYWKQLAHVHLALNNHDAATATLELALRDGALSREQELTQLAQLYLYSGIPYKAARLLEKQMETGTVNDNATHRILLAQAWSATGERQEAVRALENAVNSAPDPELRLQLAQWYFEEERWQAAETLLQPVTNRQGNSKFRAQAWLLLGIARFEQGKSVAAREAFHKASQLPGVNDTAHQWLQFIDTLAKENT